MCRFLFLLYHVFFGHMYVCTKSLDKIFQVFYFTENISETELFLTLILFYYLRFKQSRSPQVKSDFQITCLLLLFMTELKFSFKESMQIDQTIVLNSTKSRLTKARLTSSRLKMMSRKRYEKLFSILYNETTQGLWQDVKKMGYVSH